MRFQSLLLCFFFSVLCINLFGQEKPYRAIYLAGNISGLDASSAFLTNFLNIVENDENPSSIFFLGDFSTRKKLNKPLTERLSSLKSKQDIDVRFFPGDKEWNQLSATGSKYVKDVEDNIEDTFKKAFLPNDGCPGPHETKIDKNTVLLSINTSWFLTTHAKQEGFSSYCDLLFETEFWEELDDLIEDNEGKNIIIAGHHPVHSNGYYAGKGSRLIEWVPVLGSLFYAYRNNDGSGAYLSNKRYQHFRTLMERVLEKHHGLIYLSGHEHSIEIQNVDGNLHINSGATSSVKTGAKNKNSLFTQYNQGFTCISLYKDGRVKAKVFNTENKNKTNSYVDYVMLSPCTEHIADDKIINYQFSDCKTDMDVSEAPKDDNIPKSKTGRVIPGEEYSAGGFIKAFMGKHYRKDWSTEVIIPYLDLQNDYGGLKAFGKGGGKQTNSLKLINKNKEQFAFRSVNKDTGRDPYDPFRNTLVTSYTQELISNQLPFGDILVSNLLDNTDILHARPRAYLMPDDPSLGIFREDFAHILGSVEERPKGKKGIRPGFADADKIFSSNQMYRLLAKDNKNYIDTKAFAKSILFDVWTGDWDKHGDNWKWAGYKEVDHYKFVPIPKDRDHVFAIYEGIIPTIAKYYVPFYADFTEDLDNVRAITYQGRHLVNFIGSRMTKEDWQDAADYLQSSFNEQNIDAAFETLPAEMKDISKERVKTNLTARLDQLGKAAENLYSIYNKSGLFVGTNNKEVFNVTRNLDGSVHVALRRAKNDKLIFEKMFFPEDTKIIDLYGLGKDDQFLITGECDHTIPVRIIGGKGEDIIRDLAKVKGGSSVTKIYDKYGKDKIEAGENTQIKKDYQDPEFDLYDFEFNSFLPVLAPSYTTDFGLFFAGAFSFANHGFNKPDYRHKIVGSFAWVPGFDNFKTDGVYQYRQFWNDRNLLVRYSVRINDLNYDDFFGISNNTRINPILENNEFYDFGNNNYSVSIGMDKQFFNKSSIEFGIGIEQYFTSREDDNATIFDLPQYNRLLGLGNTASNFFYTQLEINLLNNTTFPRSGARFIMNHRLYKLLNDNKNFFGKAEASLIEYHSFELIKEATLAIKLGGSYNYGKTPFYHLSSLGNNNNLRNYTSNVLLGLSSVYSNFLLRHSVGTLQNKIFPFNYGLLFYYDIGRVFNDEQFSFDDWSYGYGTGVYLSFLDGAYNLNFSIGKNKFQENFIGVGLGFGLE